MTTAAKVASGVAAASTASVGGIYFGTDLFNQQSKSLKRTVSSLLREKNPEKRLINPSVAVGDKAWKEAWSRYRNANKTTNPWGVTGWSQTSETVNSDTAAPEDFISKCSTKSALEVSGTEDSIYNEVLSYCTRATLVSDLISENNRNRKILKSTDQNQEGDWKKVWDVYKSKNSNKAKDGDVWKLQGWEAKHSGDTLPDNYKTTCDSKIVEEVFKLDDQRYLNVLSWCTVEG
ncbi:hypothetical protein HF1_02820 [Mycoplasma haemofelis str. Langford 1]|uniref:Uncharacterized protein n=1 Tax=Mycoplasma haemofelis (strain Langford 1) TaxID=941640 RepID=E8ZGL9_MYCHL|nr:hypothetical protein [Mycoplasma haemofelis]CBY92290.1 hypothetical protein HF1_02820 [Mycoplasma haemofelis str. Langford 1]